MGLKTPEVKWMSIKRWVTTTPGGVTLPAGCFLSIKRRETFIPAPAPKLDKKDFMLVMFPYGNVWSQSEPDIPITEEWLWSIHRGRMIFEMLLEKDAANPIAGYYKACLDYMRKNPDQIGIHLKRKKKLS